MIHLKIFSYEDFAQPLITEIAAFCAFPRLRSSFWGRNNQHCLLHSLEVLIFHFYLHALIVALIYL